MIDVALVRGDGIGPEIAAATVAAVEASGARVRWIEAPLGEAASALGSGALPASSLQTIRRLGVALKAPLVAHRQSGGVVVEDANGTRRHPSPNSGVRRELGLHTNLRPVRGYPGVSAPSHATMDVVLVREVTEDTYAGLERRPSPDRAEAIKLITRAATRRVTQFACDWARTHGRATITAVHKANVLHETDGLFLEEARRVVAEHPPLRFDDRMVDAAGYALVRAPGTLDVLVLPNQYGDILSDVAAGLVGSLGLAPGANYGDEAAVFEAAHGAAPDIAGRGLANPLALVLSAALLLDHVGEAAPAARVRRGVTALLTDGRALTPDLGGAASTTDLARALASHIAHAEVQEARA
jgi:isocitrate dehydrogenase (NAD+)